MKLFSFLLGACALSFVAGCNTSPETNYDSVELVNVSGTVTLDDKPLPDAVVKFESPEGQYSMGKTNANGEYTLQFDSVKKGVTPGEKTVRISTAATLGEGMVEEEGGSEESSEAPAEKKTELVPEKYNKNSELKVTVNPGESQTFNFDLKSK